VIATVDISSLAMLGKMTSSIHFACSSSEFASVISQPPSTGPWQKNHPKPVKLRMRSGNSVVPIPAARPSVVPGTPACIKIAKRDSSRVTRSVDEPSVGGTL
jgi:hypothetical protein